MKKAELSIDEIQKILPSGVKVKVVSELPSGGLQILAQNIVDDKYIHYKLIRNRKLHVLKVQKYK